MADQLQLPDPGTDRSARLRRPTATSSFGSSRRESHDASAFYQRFVAPEISDDDTLGTRTHPVDVIHVGDASHMDRVDDATVALVVTSPPYYAGKEYEQALGMGHIPESYRAYLDMLTSVFAECVRTLEPGGRIAVNVANLGRRPYRSLSADVVDILQNQLRLLLRGEVIWWKGRAAGGSCAWGSFQRPANPVLRDLTERVVIASKGRFDRALTPRQRLAQGAPSTSTLFRDEFLEATADVWELAPERATRVGHPAPFPVELPLRLIDLYTYRDDLVLDPFMGSGSTAVAAVRAGRHYVGYDTDRDYVAAATRRVAAEGVQVGPEDRRRAVALTATPIPVLPEEDLLAGAVRGGRQAKDVARMVVEQCGFTHLRDKVTFRGLGVAVSLVARDSSGRDWAFDVSGGFTTTRSGLAQVDNLWKALGTAGVLHQARPDLPLVLLTTDLPPKGSPGLAALRAVRGLDKPVFDVIELLSDIDHQRLRGYAAAGFRPMGVKPPP